VKQKASGANDTYLIIPSTTSSFDVKKSTKRARIGGADECEHQPNKSNPLPFALKYDFLVRMFPTTHFFNSTEHNVPNNIVKIVEHLHDTYPRICLVVGSDRVAAFTRLFSKAHPYVEVASAGERDPDAEGILGMSGSKMRTLARKGDFTSFIKGVPDGVNANISRKLFDAIRENLSLLGCEIVPVLTSTGGRAVKDKKKVGANGLVVGPPRRVAAQHTKPPARR